MATEYKLVRVESSLYKAIAKLAKADHRTITKYTNLLLADAVEDKSTTNIKLQVNAES